MSFPENFAKDFSVLTAYNYENKSQLLKYLDFGWQLLGGASICLITKEMKECNKILLGVEAIAVAALTFYAPAVGGGLIAGSVIFFVAKVLLVKHTSEIDKIKEEFSKNTTMNSFNTDVAAKKYGAINAHYIAHPSYFNGTPHEAVCKNAGIMLDFFGAVHHKNDAIAMRLYQKHPFIATDDRAKAAHDQVKGKVVTSFMTACKEADFLQAIEIYQTYPISEENDVQGAYNRALENIQEGFQNACAVADAEKDDATIVRLYEGCLSLQIADNKPIYDEAKAVVAFHKANEDGNHAEVVRLYDGNKCIATRNGAEYIYKQHLTILAFYEAIRANNYQEVIKIYKDSKAVRDMGTYAHRAYQQAVVHVFKQPESSLQDAAEALCLIPDLDFIRIATKEMMQHCYSTSSVFDQGELAGFFDQAFEKDKAAIANCCTEILNAQKLGKLNVKESFSTVLAQVLLINDLVSIVEEIPDSNVDRATIFANVTNFDKDDVEGIRTFIKVDKTLGKSLMDLQTLFALSIERLRAGEDHDRNKKIEDAQMCLEEFKEALETFQFTEEDKIKALLRLMVGALKDKINAVRTELDDNLLQIEEIYNTLVAIKDVELKEERGDVLDSLYKSRHNAILVCVNNMKTSLFKEEPAPLPQPGQNRVPGSK